MRRLNFTQKLVLITALASGLVWLLFGSMFFYVTRDNLENQLTQYQITKTRNLIEAVDRSLFSARQGIQVLAQDGRLIDFLAGEPLSAASQQRAQISEHLESLSLLTGPWRLVTLLDTQGNVLVSNLPEEKGRFIEDHPEHEAAVQAALNNRVYSSDLHLVGERNSPSLIFTAPIRRYGQEEAEVIGVVLGKYAWPVITQLLDEVGNEVDVKLLRNDGTIVATDSSHAGRIGDQSAQWQALNAADFDSRDLVLDTRGKTDLNKDDQPSLIVATRQIGHLGYRGKDWLLVLKTPFEVLLAPVYRLTWQLAGTALIGVLVLCVALFIASAYLTRPIKAMDRTVRAFSSGDMSARAVVDPKARDEISDLGRVFNAMAEDIGFYIEQVRENSREVQSFAYIVSHDLRAPLVNLKGFSAELGYSLEDLKVLLAPSIESLSEEKQAQATEILDEDIPEALQFIGSSVERMDGQIQAILQLSRLGRKELTWSQVDSAEVVRQVLASLRHQLDEKQVTVETGTLPVVEADAFALGQIFGNLLDNAVKYMTEPPGKIRIWSDDTEADEVRFHIRDNGPGIDAANIEKVFELFRRVGRTDTPGEGMGLAYVKTLVRRHGGRIDCKSTLGKGSTFSFSLLKKPSAPNRGLG